MKNSESLSDLLEKQVKYLYSLPKFKNWAKLSSEVGISKAQLNKIYNGKHRLQDHINGSTVFKIQETYNRFTKNNTENRVKADEAIQDDLPMKETQVDFATLDQGVFEVPQGKIISEIPLFEPSIETQKAMAVISHVKNKLVQALEQYNQAVDEIRANGGQELIGHDKDKGHLNLIQLEMKIKF